MKGRVIAVALAVALLTSATLPAQVMEAELKAEFLERFTRFIDWPETDADLGFVIGVLGEDELRAPIERAVAGRRIGDREVEVRSIDSPDDAVECDVVFIGSDRRDQLAAVLARTRRRPILTVGDSEGWGRRGVAINFYRSSDRLRFEINREAAESGGLVISSRLLKLARIVGED